MITYKEIFDDCIDNQVPEISTPFGKLSASTLLYPTKHYRKWFSMFVTQVKLPCGNCAKEFYADVCYEDSDNYVMCDQCVPSNN